MGGKPSRIKNFLVRLRDSGKTKDFLVFLIFVFIAAVFWFITTLNDDVQISYEVPLVVDNVPDSVTFISAVPPSLTVTVKDRGMNLLRHNFSGAPKLHIKFNDFVTGNRLRVPPSRLQGALKSLFGYSSSVSSVSPDSLSLVFTRYPGHPVPVKLDYDVTVAPGMILSSPKITPERVLLFSTHPNDTVSWLKTDKVVLRDIDRNTTVEVPLQCPSGRRVEPSSVQVTFVVEQLVKKESLVQVETDKIPSGEDILFFPSKVKVEYYVPMSKYNDTGNDIRVEASFNEAVASTSDKVGIRVTSSAPYVNRVQLLQDSVEYTIVKNK